MAVRLGFEPRQRPPKGLVLPLHHRTIRRKIYRSPEFLQTKTGILLRARGHFAARFPNFEQHGTGSLLAGLIFDRVAISVGLANPFGRTDEDLPFILIFRNQNTIQTDIIHDDAVRKVIHLKRHQVVMPIALNLQPGGNCLSRRNG